MDSQPDYGPCISGEEYDKRIVGLHASLPPSPSPELERQVRREALDIAIDYRLGCNFPKPRREQLWKLQKRVDKRRIRLLFKYLFRRIFPKAFAHSAQHLAGDMVDEYATVLSRQELERFFGKDEANDPALPIDMDQLRK